LCLTKPLYLSQPKLLTFPVHIACWDSVIPWCNLVLAGFSVITYHVMGCMGTGVHLTTGVSASKLGLASMRSSPTAPGGYCFRAVH